MIRHLSLLAFAATFTLLAGCRIVPTPPKAVSAETAALVAHMPVATSAEAGKLSAELIRLGPAQIEALCATLKPWSGQDAPVQFTLGALSVHAARPGAEADRKLVARAYLAALKSASNPEAKAFLVRQLERVGRDESVSTLRGLIADPNLGDSAIRALAAIHTPKATAALARSLNARIPVPRKIALIQALGSLRASGASRDFLREATSEDPALRLEALWALANLGDPAGEKLLLQATHSASITERNKAVSFYLLYARHRAEAGAPEAAAAICRALLVEKLTDQNEQAHCAALATLAELQGDKVEPDLLAAVNTGSPAFIAAALQLAAKVKNPDKLKWIRKLDEAPSPVAKAGILRMLGAQADHGALPAILFQLKNEDPAVRAAAIEALGNKGWVEGNAALVERLGQTSDPADLDAIRDVLLRVPTTVYQQGIADVVYPKAGPAARVRILELLGARAASGYAGLVFTAARDENAEVRLAALKALRELAGSDDFSRALDLLLAAAPGAETTAARNVLLAVLERSDDRDASAAQLMKTYAAAPAAKKPMLLEYLPRLGTPAALGAVRKEMKSSTPAVRDAALRALADWPEPTPMSELLALSKSGRDTRSRVLAYRGYVRLIALKPVTEAEKIELFKKAMGAAPAAAEVKPVLAALGGVGHPEAFRLAAAYLDDPDLREEAALAAIAIAGKLGSQHADEIRATMARIDAAPVSAATKRKARAVSDGLK